MLLKISMVLFFQLMPSTVLAWPVIRNALAPLLNRYAFGGDLRELKVQLSHAKIACSVTEMS